MHITAYGLDWHVSQQSSAFHDLVISPLAPYIKIDFHVYKQPLRITSEEPVIFCQIIPPLDLPSYTNVIWIPMWDQVRMFSQTWWNRLPKTMRVVAFSDAIYRRAMAAGLRVLSLRYFKNPAAFSPVEWSQGHTLFYWNRTGLVSADFLAKLCDALKIDKLLFRDQTDPDYGDRAYFTLPSKLGRTLVEKLPVFTDREAYWRATALANIVIAPRPVEGVGLTLLESMARGCAVFAYNAPTMNEYIETSRTGYLFKHRWTPRRLRRGVQAKLAEYGLTLHPPFAYALNATDQDWEQIARLELQKLGENAQSAQHVGFAKWQTKIPDIAQFLLSR